MTRVIIAPTEFELGLLQRHMRSGSECCACGFPLYRGRHRGREAVLIRSGAGMANAAAAAVLALERFQPERLYHVGVCGVYGDDERLLTQVIVGTEAVFADTGVACGETFLTMESIDLPLDRSGDDRTIYNTVPLDDSGVDSALRRGTFLTVAASSGSRERATAVVARWKSERQSLLCEDMESAAVGLVALKAGVPCTVVRAVANICGERDYRKWKLADAAEAAQQALLQNLRP